MKNIKVCCLNKFSKSIGLIGLFEINTNQSKDFNIISVDSFDEADYIYVAITDSKFEKERYEWIRKTDLYTKYRHKLLFQTNNDNPEFAYIDDVKFLVGSPIKNRDQNLKSNVYTIPLLCHNDILIQSNEKFIKELRCCKKIYDYAFIGKTNNPSRHIFDKLNLPNFYFLDTTGTSNQGGINFEDYLKILAQSKFVLCPRGIGSSSYRLYESMMVGSVPIEWGMPCYPYEEFVKWEDFCIVTEKYDWDIKKQDDSLINKIRQSIDKSNSCEYDKMRNSSISFFDEYVSFDIFNKKIIETYLL